MKAFLKTVLLLLSAMTLTACGVEKEADSSAESSPSSSVTAQSSSEETMAQATSIDYFAQTKGFHVQFVETFEAAQSLAEEELLIADQTYQFDSLQVYRDADQIIRGYHVIFIESN